MLLPAFIQNTRRSVEIPSPPTPTPDAEPFAVSSAQRTLGFDIEQSQRTNWCWAAVAVSVSHFYSSDPWRQCELANRVLGQTKCCDNSNSNGCNRQWRLIEPLQIVGHYNERFVGDIQPPRVKAEIDGNRPVTCRIGWYWSGGRGHFVVLHGYRRSGGQWWVRVRDPSNTRRSYPIGKFATAYRDGAGEWTHTYTTKP